MGKNLDEEIEKEKIFGKNWLNNFHGNLPEGYRVTGMRDIGPILLDKKLWENSETHSELKKKKTVREFQEDCRQAVLKAGMQETEPQELWRSHFQGKITEYEWCEKVLPVYKILREMGYERRDLIG